MTWATVPYATGSSSIAMIATTASDESGVEYFFDETSENPGGDDSGWQDETSYQDSGLDPNTEYTYQVKAHDKSTNHNETGLSSSESATTSAGQDVLNGLVGHWEFDEGTGTTTADSTEGAPDGQLLANRRYLEEPW